MTKPNKIIDAHLHFYDHGVNQHDFFDSINPNLVEIVGDYSALPKQYLLNNYLHDVQDYPISGVVWHEFLSTDPIKEATWANTLAQKSEIRHALVALIDFLNPRLEETLEIYSSLPKLTAIREHLGWDNNNPKKRLAARDRILLDPNWQKQLALLNKYHFKCGLEIFAHQLPDLLSVIKLYPNINFTIALMGWPLDITEHGFKWWQEQMKQLSQHDNICIEIAAIESIWGRNWAIEQIKPWILFTIETFGTHRCMFGSHMPIAKLSYGFTHLYSAYELLVEDLSQAEQNDLFYNVALNWFRL